jgi:hypothetical protein
MMRFTLSFLAVAALLGAACDRTGGNGMGDGPLALAESPAMAAIGADIDLSGDWDWHEKTHIYLRGGASMLFGVTPEGPITRLTCESTGTLAIPDGGATFTGTTAQSSMCWTATVPPFDPFPIFPNQLDLVDGRITGRAVSFTMDTGGFPCHYSGAIRVQDGVATGIRATGSCEVPRELGHDVIVEWLATRAP